MNGVLFLLILTQLFGLAVLLWLVQQQGAFLERVQQIGNQSQLDELRAIARLSMMISLGLIPLFGGPWLVFLSGALTGLWPLDQLPAMAIPACTLPLLAVIAESRERRIRKLPVTDEALRSLVDQLHLKWRRNALPDW